MTASDAVSANGNSCSSGNSSSFSVRQTNQSKDPSTWRHGGIIKTAFGVFTGLGDDSQVAAAAAATLARAPGTLNKLPQQSKLDTPTTGALRSEQQQRPAALQNMLRTSWT